MRWSVFLASGVMSCALFPSLDGLTDGDASTFDASGKDVVILETGSDSPIAIDGGDAGDGEAGSAYRAAVLADKPVGYWRLGGTTPTVADELGLHPGQTYNAVTYGAPGAIAGDPDTAATFVDRSGWIDIPGPFKFTGKVPFSLEVWAKPDTINDYFPLMSADGPAGQSPQQGYAFYYDIDGTLVFGRYDIDAGTKLLAATGSAPAAGVWHHEVATMDGATMIIYVDGSQAASAPAGTASFTSDDFVIGADSNGTGVRFQGLLDEIAIYDHALAAAAVKHHYDVGLGH